MPFRSGFSAGLFFPEHVVLPGLAPGADVVAQARVWDAARGSSYDEARAVGGKFGRSELVNLTAGGPLIVPRGMIGLRSFRLQAGLPRFSVGVLELSGRLPDGGIVWRLRGEPGFQYVVEKRPSGTTAWQPWTILTNTS